MAGPAERPAEGPLGEHGQGGAEEEGVLEIVDDSGQVLAVTTTDAGSCAAYADGSLDYEGFLATMDGRVGPGMVTMWLGE